MLAAERGHEAVAELLCIAGANSNATITTLAKSPLTRTVARDGTVGENACQEWC